MTGTIDTLNLSRGFGFVARDGARERYFFHISGVQGRFDELRLGTRVEFDEEASDKGPRATNIRASA